MRVVVFRTFNSGISDCFGPPASFLLFPVAIVGHQFINELIIILLRKASNPLDGSFQRFLQLQFASNDILHFLGGARPDT
jgi:hypothetical protein